MVPAVVARSSKEERDSKSCVHRARSSPPRVTQAYVTITLILAVAVDDVGLRLSRGPRVSEESTRRSYIIIPTMLASNTHNGSPLKKMFGIYIVIALDY